MILTVEIVNDSGQTVTRRIDQGPIRRRQRAQARIGKVLAFAAPAITRILESRITLAVSVVALLVFKAGAFIKACIVRHG